MKEGIIIELPGLKTTPENSFEIWSWKSNQITLRMELNLERVWREKSYDEDCDVSGGNGMTLD